MVGIIEFLSTREKLYRTIFYFLLTDAFVGFSVPRAVGTAEDEVRAAGRLVVTSETGEGAERVVVAVV